MTEKRDKRPRKEIKTVRLPAVCDQAAGSSSGNGKGTV
ncbi:hypothetical protein CL3_25830 [butyrate-producing bacterium SM4/1]|nr:hypothetical protein CL3_25830 [butyrate-producing bacterium SM4/1]